MTSEEKIELEGLKRKADELGISYHPKTGLVKMRDHVRNAEADMTYGAPQIDPQDVADAEADAKAKVDAKAAEKAAGDAREAGFKEELRISKTVTKVGSVEDVERIINDRIDEDGGDEVEHVQLETKQQRKMRLRKEQTALVRVVIHCNNDQKQELNGETIKVSNGITSQTKFIPFDVDEGYHVPRIILSHLEQAVCTKWKTVKHSSGDTSREPYQTKEYSITELDPLSQKELGALAASQKSRGAID